MRQYTQLTLEQRYQIYAFKKAGFNQTKIAKEVGVHKSTISRELRRNRGFRGYRPKQAHSKAVDRKSSAAKSVKLIPGLIAMVEGLIRSDFSPEQVCGYLSRRYGLQLSHETIYQYILADKAGGGGLYKHLRHGQQPEGPAMIHGTPTLHPFWAAGFSFARGHFVVQVPYDQYLPMIFQGEEISIGLRGFTFGS